MIFAEFDHLRESRTGIRLNVRNSLGRLSRDELGTDFGEDPGMYDR